MSQKNKFLLKIGQAALEKAIFNALPTIHKQAGESTVQYFNYMFPQGELIKLDLAVRTKRHWFTRTLSIEFRINGLEGYLVKDEKPNEPPNQVGDKFSETPYGFEN